MGERYPVRAALFGLGVFAGLLSIPVRCLIQALPRRGRHRPRWRG